jgi:hypothetical protein
MMAVETRNPMLQMRIVIPSLKASIMIIGIMAMRGVRMYFIMKALWRV